VPPAAHDQSILVYIFDDQCADDQADGELMTG
jgi:hypothetical protein